MMADEAYRGEEWRVETDLLRTFTAVVRTRTASPPLPARLLVQDPGGGTANACGLL